MREPQRLTRRCTCTRATLRSMARTACRSLKPCFPQQRVLCPSPLALLQRLE